MGNDKFLGQIDEELGRLQLELESTKEAMVKATAIYDDCKNKQQRLIQELKAVDLMKQNLINKKDDEPVVETVDEDLQQPPENYEEEK